jgi:predicted metal-dependent hydrolase
MEEVEINGKQYFIEMLLSKNRNATARVKQDKIIIKIPNRWPEAEKSRVSDKLKTRIIKAIEKNPFRFAQPEIIFNDGQQLTVLGNTFNINIQKEKGKRSTARVKQNAIKIKLADGLSDEEIKKQVYRMVRKAVSNSLLPILTSRVQGINEKHFKFQFKRVRLKEMTSRWGSCSSRGFINLSFRLLFTSQEVMDYVIIHELAHLKEKNHGEAFWNLVSSAMPDYKEKRKLLNKNDLEMGLIQNTKLI